MKRLFRSSWVVITAWALGALSLSPESARAGWQLVWSDDFSGTSLATTNWTFDTGNGFWVANPGYWVPGWGNNELEYYTSRPQNVFVTNGYLHLVAQKETYNGFNYTSARLKSMGLFTKQYGRFEFRAKLPTGVGCWPALWMLPQNPTYGGWPNNGEIDVMENKGNTPTQVGGTIHYGGANGNDVYTGKTYTFPSGEGVTNFHLYALEWTNNAIRWSVDGTTYQTQTNWWSNQGTNTSRYPYPAPFDQPFYILMNLAIGGNYLGNPTVSNINANTVFPADMQVDYVRVYGWTAVTPLSASLQPSAGGLRLNWAGGILQSATNLAGSWADVPNGLTPYTVSPTNPAAFYRLRLQ